MVQDSFNYNFDFDLSYDFDFYLQVRLLLLFQVNIPMFLRYLQPLTQLLSLLSFFDSALTSSINKDHLSNLDSSNNPSTYLFVASVLQPFQLLEGSPSYVLLIDPSVVPSFGLNHDPSSVPSLIFFIVSTYTTLQPGTIQCVLSISVTDIDPTSNICSSFATSFEIRFLLFLKQFIMTKLLFHSDITSLNEIYHASCYL